MTVAEALAAAAEEGLALLRAENNATGFKGVSHNNDSASKPFRAHLWHNGRNKSLGRFATAEEAALAYARHLGPEGVAAALVPPAPKPAPMTAAEAHAAAEQEGLTLVRAENATGFKGVSRGGKCSESKPFKAQLWHSGRHNTLGYFATAEEAALAVARFLGPEGIAAALAPPAPEPAPMTAAEVHAAAVEEGLTLLRAENTAGFMYVGRHDTKGKPFQASLRHSGQQHHLGYFATAEEAALAVARFLGPECVAAALAAPMTAAEAHAAAAAEGLALLRAENPTGFKGVSRNSNSAIKPFKAQLRRLRATSASSAARTSELIEP